MDNSSHQTKNCYKCNIAKSMDNFSKDRSTRDGLQARCKRCAAEYKHNNENKLKRHRTKYEKTKKLNDPLYKLRTDIRSLINLVLRRKVYTSRSKIYVILGCSYQEFKAYIENQFLPGMTWDNRELWHLDHILPVSLGENEEEIIALNHHTNFQPLWAEDNIRKGNEVI